MEPNEQGIITLPEALEILAALAREGVDYVVIGSMALAAQGLPRATHDLDIFVAPSRENIEALKRALEDIFDDPSVAEIDPEEMAGDYPAVEYSPPHGRYSLDILTRLSEAFDWQDLREASELLHLEGVTIRVATPSMLYRMKKDTVRPQDRADAWRLRETFGIEED